MQAVCTQGRIAIEETRRPKNSREPMDIGGAEAGDLVAIGV